MASALPKLPGYYPTHSVESSPNYKRVSWIKQQQNLNWKSEAIPNYVLPRLKPFLSPDMTCSLNDNNMSTSHLAFKPHSLLPEITEHYNSSWVRLDKHVLRFYGYFKESVPESPFESYRVRKLVIFFYLIDGSLSISEPKSSNSGILQGAFLKRQRVLKADGSGSFIDAYDFIIGKEITIFGKNILLNDCDPYTREFYLKQGCPQPNQVEVPKDSYTIMTTTKFVPVKDQMMKDYLEAQLGGGKVSSQKQFLENDRKVLRYYISIDTPYILHYFLADDTIEIRKVNFPNNGKDPFPMFLKRQKLPKILSLNQPGQTNEDQFVKPHEIVYGDTIEIFGRKFRIDGCDVYTHEYYKSKYGIDFPIGKIEKSKPLEKKKRILPPYNGWGDEEDSLGYVYRLIPTAPKKDYYKWMDSQGNLRYYAKLRTQTPEDVERRFIITYYLHDDSLLIYEPEQRNSGISGGKFLEKGRFKNFEKGGVYFAPEHLYVGNIIKVNGFLFEILECDDFTKKWYFENRGTSDTGKPLQLANFAGLQTRSNLRQSI